MEQPHKTPTAAASASASSPATATASAGSSSSSSPSIHGTTSSAFLGVSSSPTHSSQSQPRRASPSLYPPPRPPVPLSGSGHLATSRGPAATASSAGSSASRSSPSSSQLLLHRISPSPWAAGKRRPRPHGSVRVTHSLPTPFLSELSSIRRTRASAFGDLNHAQEITMTQRPFLLRGQQQQEMTPSSSTSTMLPHHSTPMPSGGELSGLPAGFAPPPPLQQQQAQPSSSFTTLQPLPGSAGNFNFSGFFFPASQPQPQQMQMQPPSSSTDLPSSSSIFSGLAPLPPPASSQHFSTIFQQSSSTCSADQAQPSSSDDSVLPPLPPSLEIRQQPAPNNGGCGSSIFDQSTSGFMQPSSDSETYELAPLPESLQMPVAVAPEPESISLDGDGDVDVDELTALANSFIASSSSPGHGQGSASLLPANHMHEQQQQTTNLELEGVQGLQMGSSSSEPSTMRGGSADANGVGVGQTMEARPTQPASVRHDKVNTGGGSSSSIPRNCHASLPMYSVSRSEEQALQQLSDLLSRWSSSTAGSGGNQSMGSSVAGSCAAMPDELASKLAMMSIGGNSSSAGTKMPCNYRSLPGNSTTPVPAVPTLLLGGIHGCALPPRSPAIGAGASSSVSRRDGIKEHSFSEAHMETINKDCRLKELLKTDSKRLKRLLRYRDYAARMKEQKENNLLDLEERFDALKVECSSLSTQVQSEKEMMANLKTESREMELKLEGLQEQDRLSQNLNNQLQSEIERLKHELNML